METIMFDGLLLSYKLFQTECYGCLHMCFIRCGCSHLLRLSFSCLSLRHLLHTALRASQTELLSWWWVWYLVRAATVAQSSSCANNVLSILQPSPCRAILWNMCLNAMMCLFHDDIVTQKRSSMMNAKLTVLIFLEHCDSFLILVAAPLEICLAAFGSIPLLPPTSLSVAT